MRRTERRPTATERPSRGVRCATSHIGGTAERTTPGTPIRRAEPYRRRRRANPAGHADRRAEPYRRRRRANPTTLAGCTRAAYTCAGCSHRRSSACLWRAGGAASRWGWARSKGRRRSRRERTRPPPPVPRAVLRVALARAHAYAHAGAGARGAPQGEPQHVHGTPPPAASSTTAATAAAATATTAGAALPARPPIVQSPIPFGAKRKRRWRATRCATTV